MEPLTAADPVQVGGYRLVARLGAGGMGRVYLARSPGGRPVALKVIRENLVDDPQFRGRFVREVNAARAVSGHCTAPVVDAEPDGRPAWLATAYVAGVTLAEAVARFGPLPLDAAGTLGGGLAEALVAVHAAGLVHRDLKPSNVIIAADGPKVIDFGIARLTASATRYTSTDALIGSPGYFAPEQVDGGAVGPATDVFALASVVVFALTGRGPFGGGEPLAMLYQVVHADPDLSGVPAALRPVLAACLAKDPARRPAPADLIAAFAVGADRGDGGWPLPPGLAEAIVAGSRMLLAAGPVAAGPEPATVADGAAPPAALQGPPAPSPGPPAAPPKPPAASPGPPAGSRTRRRGPLVVVAVVLVAAVLGAAVLGAAVLGVLALSRGLPAVVPVPGPAPTASPAPPTGSPAPAPAPAPATPAAVTADAIAGTWAGTGTDGLGRRFQVRLDIRRGCELRQVCGRISVSQVPCSGELSLHAVAADRYEFSVDRFSAPSSADCTPGAGEYLSAQPGGTLHYTTGYDDAIDVTLAPSGT